VSLRDATIRVGLFDLGEMGSSHVCKGLEGYKYSGFFRFVFFFPFGIGVSRIYPVYLRLRTLRFFEIYIYILLEVRQAWFQPPSRSNFPLRWRRSYWFRFLWLPPESSPSAEQFWCCFGNSGVSCFCRH